MRDEKAGGMKGWAGPALAVPALAVTAAFAWAMMGGMANAQSPPPIYDIPTPTPTPTPSPTATPSAPRKLAPFPRIRTAGSFSRRRTRFTRITVKAPRGARIDARCSRRRCKRTRRTATGRSMRIKRMQRSYKPGSKLILRVTDSEAIGKYVLIRTRRGKPPVRRDKCLLPGVSSPSLCGDAG